MKAQFLKIAGVKSDEEFYDKYPTEDDFFTEFPEASIMRKGGEMQYGGIPNIVPAINATTGNSRMMEPIKFLTGAMGLASGLAGSALGYTNAMSNITGTDKLDNVNNGLKEFIDFNSDLDPSIFKRKQRPNQIVGNKEAKSIINNSPIYEEQPYYAAYGGDLPKAQWGTDTTNGPQNEDYTKFLERINSNSDGRVIPNFINPNFQEPIENRFPKTSNQGYATKAIAGLGAFNNYLDYKENRHNEIDYNNRLKQLGNTDSQDATNPLNPFGNYTLNAGPASNFQLSKNTPIQNFGTYKEGGSATRKFKSGGQYNVSHEELMKLMDDGAEIEFL